MKAACLTLLAATSAVLAQGTVTYSWDVNGTGLDTVTIGPGGTVSLTLYADWTAQDEVVGIAGTIYDIVGVENWTTGTIVN